jgi:hypothetical protein
MIELVSGTEAIGGASLGTETLVSAGVAESLGGMGIAGEVAASILAPEILIPAVGVGLAIKELYDIFDEIF